MIREPMSSLEDITIAFLSRGYKLTQREFETFIDGLETIKPIKIDFEDCIRPSIPPSELVQGDRIVWAEKAFDKELQKYTDIECLIYGIVTRIFFKQLRIKVVKSDVDMPRMLSRYTTKQHVEVWRTPYIYGENIRDEIKWRMELEKEGSS